jgi:hypothetical protein
LFGVLAYVTGWVGRSRGFNKEFWTMIEGGRAVAVFQAQAGVRLKGKVE